MLRSSNSTNRLGPPAPGAPIGHGARDPLAFGALAVVLATGILGDNIALTIVAGAVLFSSIRLLWTNPPALVIAAGLQFVPVGTKIIQANLLGVQINALSDFGGDIDTATMAALGGLFALVIGMSIGLRIFPARRAQEVFLDAAQWTPNRAFVFCLATMGLQLVFEAAARLSGGLAQVLLAAGGIQWVGVFVLTYTCIARRSGSLFIAAVLLVEVAVGLTGIYSNFKEVFFVVLIAMLGAHKRISFGALFGTSLIVGGLILISTYWTVVKPQYRAFISVGDPSIEERYTYLSNAASAVDGAGFVEGLNKLAARVSYIDFFALTKDYVPRVRPHEEGAMLGAALSHIFYPRLLFPDKPPLESDTAVTGRYTGITAYQEGFNASISLGFFAELYVDFGVIGMSVCLFVLGLLYGIAFGLVSGSSRTPPLIGAGIGVMVALSFWQFERSLPKTIGAAVTTFAISWVLVTYLMPILLRRFGPRQGSAPRHQLRVGAE